MASHLAILLWAPGCLVAAWWQATVAMSGNALSYLYAAEWPAFAIFGVVVWWNFLHDDPEAHGNRGLNHLRRHQRHAETGEAVTPGPRRDEESTLRAYNDYLEQLSRENRPKTWRRQ
ncbi:MAG TPA: hypothetical protein VMU99_10170 [Acidimicrobiales bacterium]|nr:hypothetical protein [Acidimicrobiales bacterium]